MIANEGYIPLSLMREKNYWELCKQAKTYSSEISSTILTLYVDRPDDIARHWLVDYCADELFLTDGIGRPIRIDPDLVRRTYFHIDLSEPPFSRNDYVKPEVPKSLSHRFSFCNPFGQELIGEFNDLATRLSVEADAENAEKLNHYRLMPVGLRSE